ncbi:hypothetical protein DAEQUDRAFT_766771 [Daedalea quercina L-15889]|uniref:Uncharacterized protein n=1 Tax=Daedalea quercina L-15889 TaxID=1314783 RepID=A0A165P670_9APHY|nr:hypothetical protein DAEQUDRAFT_766771 [Daedalea quercina L-15889]
MLEVKTECYDKRIRQQLEPSATYRDTSQLESLSGTASCESDVSSDGVIHLRTNDVTAEMPPKSAEQESFEGRYFAVWGTLALLSDGPTSPVDVLEEMIKLELEFPDESEIVELNTGAIARGTVDEGSNIDPAVADEEWVPFGLKSIPASEDEYPTIRLVRRAQ